MHDLSNYNIYTCKDGRVRAYNKITHAVTSYPRLLMEIKLGRPLLKTEDVHHIDENPQNNNIENLEVVDHREHDRQHARKYFDKEMICPICGKTFIWTAYQQVKRAGNMQRKNRIIPKIGPCCSKSCAGKASAMTIKENKRKAV